MGPLRIFHKPRSRFPSFLPVVRANLGRSEEDMPRSSTTLTLDDAKRMLQAGEAAAASIGIAYNIAVVDAGGNLLAFVRQGGALIGSIDLTIGKAVTAWLFDQSTSELAQSAQPGEPLFGIQQGKRREDRDLRRSAGPDRRQHRRCNGRQRGNGRARHRGSRGRPHRHQQTLRVISFRRGKHDPSFLKCKALGRKSSTSS